MYKWFKRFIVSVVCLLMVTIGTVYAQVEQGTLMYDGIARTYELYVPQSLQGDETVPLVVALHPTASSGRALEARTDFDAAAEANGFIVVYPNTVGLLWNEGRDGAGLTPLEPIQDDVGFIAALIDELSTIYPIDAEHIYLTGFGNGGLMAYYAACALPQRFAAVAVVSTLMWDYHRDFCEENGAPQSLLLIHGTRDLNYTVLGREIAGVSRPDGSPYRVLGREAVTEFWRAHNACTEATLDEDEPLSVQIYSGCEANSQLIVFPVGGGGHDWYRLGDYSLNQHDIDATDVVTRFFMGEDIVPDEPAEGYRGTPRSYLTYVPASYDADQPTPLVIALHGRPGNGGGYAFITDFNAVAEEEGFIVVYPDGMSREWNYIGDLWNIPGYSLAERDDISFLVTLIDDLSIDLNIDRSRVYLNGFSNGGFMTQRMACEVPDVFAAFAAIGSLFQPEFHDNGCDESLPTPILLMHGTDDISIPWSGLTMVNGSQVIQTSLSAQETAAYWVVHNNCDTTAFEVTELPEGGESPGTSVIRYDFYECPDGAPVAFWVIVGGGHNLPGVPGVISEEIAGNVNMDIHAARVMWAFFEQFTLQTNDPDE